MKILVTGNYKDGHSGWARACQEFILALDKVATVVPRAYKLNQDAPAVRPRILELEQNDEVGCDVVFHIGLPHNYRRPHCKSVSFLFIETNNFSNSPWPRQLNCTSDLVLVPNDDAMISCINSGIMVPVKKCYVPTDLSRYEDTTIIPELKAAVDNDFIFYTVGELTPRKGLHHLLRAFHLEFTPNEPVSLVIKTGKYGVPEQEIKNQFGHMAREVKDSLRVRQNYKQEILITEKFSDGGMIKLHNTGDCYVSTSYGECWGFPLIDALGVGNVTISNSVGAPNEFSTLTCKHYPVPCADKGEFDFLCCGDELWGQIDITVLRYWMRKIYEQRPKKEQERQKMAKLSYETVGRRLIELFETI